jgi:hypothetical protein
MKRAIKPPPIKFPPTPEHPVTVNADLQYRLDFLRAHFRLNGEIERVQNHLKTLKTPAWARSRDWDRERILKSARVAFEEFGPLTGKAQREGFDDFVRSLEENKEGSAA